MQYLLERGADVEGAVHLGMTGLHQAVIAGRVGTAPGEVALDPQQGGGGFQVPDVTDQQCADVKTAMQKKPAEAQKLDALRERMRSGAIDRQQMRDESQKVYATLGVDPRTAMACRFRESRAQGTPTGTPPAARADTSRTGRQNRAAPATGQLQIGNAEASGSGQRVRPSLVFVAKGKSFEPRVVMLGAGNFDYMEVVSGLQEGEEVALLSALALQAQRQQQNDRFRQGMGGVPGMSQNQNPAGGARPGGAGGAGGAAGRQR